MDWEDRTDQYSEAIRAAHPVTGDGTHERYARAAEMVGNRQSKGALVELVNYLLSLSDAKPLTRMKRTVPAIELTPQKLAGMRFRFQPIGSGPLLVMRTVVQLIEAIAEDKGWDLDQVEYTLINSTGGKVTGRWLMKGMEKVRDLEPGEEGP